MIRRPPRSTRTDTLFPTRRSSDLGGDADVERHISINALTLDVVGEADHRGLGDQRVEHQRAFDLGGAHAVARDVDDVIDAAGYPVIAIRVAPAAVARAIITRIGREIVME